VPRTSWGSTLALAYAIAHPETVQTLILRGVFLCRRADVDYFLQGNAAEFAADPLAMPRPGTYLDFPASWERFATQIPRESRGDVVKALAGIFASPPRSDAERERMVEAASACIAWENSASRLKRDDRCSLHQCQIQAAGTTKDRKWDAQYFRLRTKLLRLEQQLTEL
jgi:proline iminopeptidase